MRPSQAGVLRKMGVGLKRINWIEVLQSIANGAAQTIGTITIYLIVVLIVFAWYRRAKNTVASAAQTSGQNQTADALSNALTLSRPVAAVRDAEQALSMQSPQSTSSWV